ncbi:MAG: PD-(D/E)XK nuclease family protein [Ignavibacteriales bacterium]|nr:PD-(D/E)XK nuclease family protein [Ignavibacteriales bacterium]
MSSIKIISAQENLIDVLAAEMTADDKDYSRQVIVFPGKRPSHFLRKMLAERENTSFFPPKIFSMDEFNEYLFRDILGYHQQTLESIDAVAILFEVHKKTEQRLGRSHYDSFDNFFPVALKLLGELEEVMMANQTARRVKEVLQNIEFAKFHSLAEYFKNFYEEVDRRGYVTRSMIYRAVTNEIEKIDFSSHEKIILAGFYAFTNVEKKIIEGLQKKSNVKFIFQYGIGLIERLKLLGFDVKSEENYSVRNNEPDFHFYKASDTHGQVYALAAEIKKRTENGNEIDHHTAVVLPSSEALFPAIHFPLSLLKKETYNIALGYPIKRTPAYGFLNNLLELAATAFNNKFSASSYLRVVLHPYVKNIRHEQRSDVTRIMFHQLEKYLAEEKSKALLSLELIESDEQFFDSCTKALAGIVEGIDIEQLKSHLKSIHDNTIRKFVDIKSIGDFAQKAIEVLNYIFNESTANLHPYFKPYVQKLMEALDQVAHSLVKAEKFAEPAGYIIFLQHYLESETVPFHGTPLRGLQVLGLLETRNLAFDTLYFIDANDDIVPGKPGEDMLLPQHIRKMLGLETYHDREKLIEYYFDLVVSSAKDVHLFYSENQKDGKKEKSRFVQKLLWQKQQESMTDKLTPFEKTIRYGVKLENPKPKAINKTKEIVEHLRTIRYSASQLDTYLACQLKFYYQNVLQLREKTEVSDEIDSLDVGILIHTVLEEYFKPFLGKKIEKEEITRSRLEEVIAQKMKENYGTDWLGPTFMMQTQIVNHLWQFIEEYQIPALQKSEIIIKDLEKKCTVETKGITFTGKIDRIELRGNAVYIIDYKTSKDDQRIKIRLDKLDIDNRETYREAIGSFQLPMYMLLYSQQTGTSLENIMPAYLFLGRNQLNEEIEVSIGGDEISSVEIFDSIRQVIFKLVDEILNINQPFSPTEFLEDECSKCPYGAICGTTWVSGVKLE